MKRIYIILSLFSILVGACIDNESDLGKLKISKITFKTEFNKIPYRMDRWGTFELQCPEIMQENEEKPLTYRWDINYKTVGNEKDLKFVCNELTPPDQKSFPCRLTVSNEDGASWLDFELIVTSPYEEGILIMSKTDGGSMLSFKREDKPGQEFQLNAYKINNPDFPLGVSPKAMLQLNEFIYIGTEQPNKIVKVNSQTMEVNSILDYPGKRLDFMIHPNPSAYAIYCFDNGREMELDGTQDAFMNSIQQLFDDIFPGCQLAHDVVSIGGGDYFYNNTDGILFEGYSLKPIFPKEFEGKTLIDMITCKNNTEMLAIVKKIGQEPDIVYLAPQIPVHYSTTSVAGTGINSNSIFVASQQYSRLYYSVGNRVYVYDYSSGSNFPTTASYTVGQAGDIIKSMVLTPDDSKLYIAWESVGNEELKGNAKCIVLSGEGEDWEKKGVAGEIIEMIYKEKNQ